MLWPPGTPLWLIICGHTSLCIVIFSITVVSLPYSLIARIKMLRKLRTRLVQSTRRMVMLSLQGPFFRFFIFLGQKCSCGYCSSRCRSPSSFRSKAAGCSEVVLWWTPCSTYNPFHEESYVVAWRRLVQEGQEDWQEQAADDNDSPDKEGRKWRFYLDGLPEQEKLALRVCAVNRYGRSPWTDEVGVETLARPSKDGGFTGPLGPAGRDCGSGIYTWTQSTKEICIKVPILESWKARDIRFKATPHRLEMLYVGSHPPARAADSPAAEPQELLAGSFPKKVRSDEVFWEIDTSGDFGRHISIQMQKAETMEKWPCLLEGGAHPHIDTRLVRFLTKGADSGFDIFE